mgnify:CR=1 FL=1
MTRVIEKKIWTDMFENDQELDNDFRLADFELQPGDVIVYKEWDPQAKAYTGREYRRVVKDVTKHGNPGRYWSQEELNAHGVYVINFEQEK